ncbi:hypothetical protein RAA17_17930 [Komagataeibacter rhaeticus]|nr:hypothetical protein [Komagataeibacter rhaeticus]
MADDIRPIGTFLHRTAAEGGWRVVIVDGADYMNRTAANAILKILEEPPERAILILTAAMPGRLLPTIRSRCRVLNLAPMDNAAMHAVLSAMPDAPPPTGWTLSYRWPMARRAGRLNCCMAVVRCWRGWWNRSWRGR